MPRLEAFFNILLEDDKVVLLQVKGRVRVDDDLGLELPFQFLHALVFFVLQQTGHAGMCSDDDLLLVGRATNPADLAENFVRDRGR